MALPGTTKKLENPDKKLFGTLCQSGLGDVVKLG